MRGNLPLGSSVGAALSKPWMRFPKLEKQTSLHQTRLKRLRCVLLFGLEGYKVLCLLLDDLQLDAMSEAREGAVSTAPAATMSTEKISLGSLFQQCITYASEVTKHVPSTLATEINAIVKRIDDSYFRLQIWGSDMSAHSSKSFTFDDILAFSGSALPATIEDSLKAFEQSFRVVARVLSSFTAESSTAVMM